MCEQALYNLGPRSSQSPCRYQSNWGTLLDYVDMSSSNTLSTVLFSSIPSTAAPSPIPVLPLRPSPPVPRNRIICHRVTLAC